MDVAKEILKFGLVLLSLCHSADSKCTISSNWIKLSRDERILMSQNVVYGKTTQHLASVKNVDGKSFYTIDAIFEVYCIFKGISDIKGEITIESIAPRDGCSGTRDHMKIGDEAIVGIKQTDDNTYEYDEIMPTQSASFAATKETIESISKMCEMQAWRSPTDAKASRCPVCNISNFTEEVMKTAEDAGSLCQIDGIDVSNATDCSFFTTGDAVSDSVCIPEDFNMTCARLMYTRPTVTCECTSSPPREAGGRLSETDVAMNNIPSLLMLFAGFLFALFSA